ncbi:hypothetical protein [Chitinophaga sp. OAE865]|uniref:hypothetical protein n=1 Tax=Chitinophaga sp. OAE865 TaxID=2817898 RepID=UPI001AEB1398
MPIWFMVWMGMTVDYLIGGSTSMILDKKLLKRMEDIEALPGEEKKNLLLHQYGYYSQ